MHTGCPGGGGEGRGGNFVEIASCAAAAMNPFQELLITPTVVCAGGRGALSRLSRTTSSAAREAATQDVDLHPEQSSASLTSEPAASEGPQPVRCCSLTLDPCTS